MKKETNQPLTQQRKERAFTEKEFMLEYNRILFKHQTPSDETFAFIMQHKGVEKSGKEIYQLFQTSLLPQQNINVELLDGILMAYGMGNVDRENAKKEILSLLSQQEQGEGSDAIEFEQWLRKRGDTYYSMKELYQLFKQKNS